MDAKLAAGPAMSITKAIPVKALEHERKGDRNGARGTYVHGYGYNHDRNHGQQRVLAQRGEEAVRHKDGDKGSHNKTDDKPFTYGGNHVDEAVA